MSAVATPTRQAILNLYHTSLRTSQSFSSYNFREYFVRRTKDSFRTIQVRWSLDSGPCLRLAVLTIKQKETDPERLRVLYAEAVKEQTILQRSALVNQLYGGWKVAVEVQDTATNPETVLERGNN